MGGRFGKYGDLKRKAALHRSRMAKRRLQNETVPRPPKRRKAEQNIPNPR
jgi:hypothetical protein